MAPANTAQAKTQFGYRRHPDQDRSGANVAEHPVVVVGAGPVGLSLAIDLAQRGQRVVLLDDADRIGEGSRAICFSKRSLEFWDRLGVGDRMVEKGVVWSVGKIFHGASQLYQFNLLPEEGHKRPAFINLQQFYAEAYLVDRVEQLPEIDLRWRNKVIALESRNDGVALTIATPEGAYQVHASFVVACDGARSSLRQMVGADFAGQVFEDQFLIADVKMTAAFPTERWFWFDPPFHAGRSALLHKQPDDIWRIDLQLNPDADPVAEKQPENVRPRIERMLGHDKFEFEWISLYKFQCRRMAKFIHGRVIFAGDSAHQVSPFGARGANSGLEDAENLSWKLDRVLRRLSPEGLLETYHIERSAAADENIRESTRSTDFMAPVTRQEARLREAVLSLAKDTEFGKRMVNGGRLSVPSVYDTPLSSGDRDSWRGGPRPGASMLDAPVTEQGGGSSYLTDVFIRQGTRFTLLEFGNGVAADVPDGVGTIRVGGEGGLVDAQGLAGKRYDAEPGTAYLLRPDGYVAARFRNAERPGLDAALARASGLN
ncbi:MULTISPECIES: FAD-dependent oxidoreductase [unclassified Bradyrhizobium]|uniref:FAD-dependent oxidoreductase n=1 Tax=unclassified Bradyrhizobium TaxID=2631580 RepID=UPI001BAE4928|nr:MULTISPECIES: FAD-dependent oxidoreductase [unclassified Bradyrhizobium]MBR1206111.1 FAD-dependent oxidoreductase [Bradyrhizobium sp. AUGA SZCCT0124]MBR1314763.1 FAD-dependent oxidoreductase [Bradyrhizobium sp. AUGA SZCCT0051]MBR1341734.1 FAD-dependent oxidoreductase [Bradyrhizobium sp. AUGA SZCCT0105]MBR1358865.1 FAD-dependent oxidoreductase [Bradyrhizobium sp. AUGA SZCCT0045]